MSKTNLVILSVAKKFYLIKQHQPVAKMETENLCVTSAICQVLTYSDTVLRSLLLQPTKANQTSSWVNLSNNAQDSNSTHQGMSPHEGGQLRELTEL